MWPAWVVYAFGSFIDIFAEFELVPDWIHFAHYIIYLVFMIIISQSIYRFYQGWKKMGMQKI